IVNDKNFNWDLIRIIIYIKSLDRKCYPHIWDNLTISIIGIIWQSFNRDHLAILIIRIRIVNDLNCNWDSITIIISIKSLERKCYPHNRNHLTVLIIGGSSGNPHNRVHLAILIIGIIWLSS